MQKNRVSPDQLVLPGFESDALPVRESRRRTPFNLFFAIYPEPEAAFTIAEQATTLISKVCDIAKLQKAERLHVSLHNLGGYSTFPQERVDTAKRIADDMVFSAFDITFDRAARFGGNAFVLYGGANQELFVFQRALGKSLQGRNLLRLRSFTPHMTIAYQKPKIAERKIAPIRWTVEGFSLIWSHQGKERHDKVGDWRFAS